MQWVMATGISAMRPRARTVIGATTLAGLVIACLGLFTRPAAASVGGPELSEPMGYDPRTHDVYFKQLHWNESDVRSTVVRLRPGHGPRLFEPVAWSIGEDEDSTYKARVAALARRLKPLRTWTWGTIPGSVTIAPADTVERFGERWARYRVSVGWFEGAALGTIHVVTYRDPTVRIVRWYAIPGSKEAIGVVSFVGVATEMGYESQVPVVVPREVEELTIPEDWWRTGYLPQ